MAALPGKQALTEIDKVLAKARDVLSRVDHQFGSARNSFAQLRQEEIGIYARLARLRLVAIEQGDLIDTLDRTDREVTAILEQRARASADLEKEIEAAEAALAATETSRADQQDRVDEAGRRLDAAEAEAQAALEADDAYRAQLARTEQADFVADQAEAKASAAEADRISKGRPYEDDTLFSYLWRRGYGTSAYRAFPLTRWLDGKVAKICNYEPARRNYSLLTSIPVRLAEHARAMRDHFEREAESLAGLEDQAAASAQVPAFAKRLEEAEEKLGEFDRSIAAQEDQIRELIVKRKSFATGGDSYYTRCIGVLSEAMQRRGIELLEARAARTPSREDDALVRQLAEIQREAAGIEQDLTEFSRLHDQENGRVGELEDLRRRFKTARFDDSLSEFKDWALIALVLNQFLSGGARSGDIWKAIKRQQRTKRVQANPNFGTLRFPRAGRHGPWRMPKGGFGGGGFRTGGGFRGGGGFKTGGGF